MKLFLKRDLSADGNVFTVFNDLGEAKYLVLSKKPGTNAKINLAVCDTNGKPVARLRRVPIAGTKIFVIKANGKRISLVLLITSKGMYCNFYGVNWHISGELITKNFSIMDVDNSLIMSHLHFSDRCELEIPDKDNELFCVAAAICVNLINTLDSPALQTA
ncbi:MAG: hypothetical protein IIZ36_04085 [Ruminococcus sp.]|nr:hypothetical protein [Ruminococcus sp.]